MKKQIKNKEEIEYSDLKNLHFDIAVSVIEVRFQNFGITLPILSTFGSRISVLAADLHIEIFYNRITEKMSVFSTVTGILNRHVFRKWKPL